MGYRQGDETVTFEARMVGPKTAKAWLIEPTEKLVELWLPKSQTVDWHGPYGDDMDLYEFHVTEWWAKKNGMV
jgi:hypothetical protein